MRPDERPPRPRFELPAEAKKIIHEIEPIVTMVRKIFRESCDGVNLSLEDEKFIKEKILEHHPEKEKKLSAETDNIMVNKHHIFQDSRCFYVVSSDGTQTDFSYNKCMDNYVRKTYAEEHAELVSRMYFMKRNRDQAPAPAADGATAPMTPAEASQSTLAEASQATPAHDAQLETPASPSATQQETQTPAPPGETASQETPASPSATTRQETPEAAAPPVDKWAEKPDSAWGAGTSSDDKWA
jgi:DNA-directed RNA polymerase-5 subunit 1